jgi:hypothetical protein
LDDLKDRYSRAQADIDDESQQLRNEEDLIETLRR